MPISKREVDNLFMALHKLDIPDEETGLSPRTYLEFCLKDVEGQIEGKEQGLMAGFAAGLANNTRSPRKFAAVTEASARAQFQAQEILAHPENALDPQMLDAMDPSMQEGFLEAYRTAYQEGYQKGLQAIEPAIEKHMPQEEAEAIFEGKARYRIDPKRRALLQSILKEEDFEIALDEETIGALATASKTTPNAIQEAITFYAKSTEKQRDELFPKSSVESDPQNRVAKKPTEQGVQEDLRQVVQKLEEQKLVQENRNEQAKLEEQQSVQQSLSEPPNASKTPDNQKSGTLSGHTAAKQPATTGHEQAPSSIQAAIRPHRNISVEERRALRSKSHDNKPIQRRATVTRPTKQDVQEDLRQVVQKLEEQKPVPDHKQTPSSFHKPPICFTPTVRTILENPIKNDYLKKQKSFANILSYKGKRKEQMALIDDVRAYLEQHDAEISDKNKGIILYAVMSAIQKDLKKERPYRWTRLLFGTKSRLEAVLKDDMQAIRDNFKGTYFCEKNALPVIKDCIKDERMLEECTAILGRKKFIRNAPF